MSVRRATEIALAGEEVPGELLEAAFDAIMAGEVAPVQVAGLLIALRAKGETVAEIVASARALRARAVTSEAVDARTVDTCGTGGSGISTFNVSTTSAFVVAGAGVPVAKHGNRAASSASGSFDVLEELGVRIDLPIEACGRILAQVGIAPFFARTAHPAFRHVAPIRAELGVRTLMNSLGPLLNPVGAKFQIVGVYAGDMVEPLAAALGHLGAERALVVHGSDGLDEITTTGATHAALFDGEAVRPLEIHPEELGLPRATLAVLAGGAPPENAKILRAILGGEGGPRRDLVCLNAAGALWVSGAAEDLAQGLALARESIDSGAASARLEALVLATKNAST